MKIALIGYGKIGNSIHKLANARQHSIVAIIDPFHSEATSKTITTESLNQADVAICFTQPNAALNNIHDLAKCKIPMVIGTTGWLDHLASIKEKIEKENLHFIYSSNFSLGVNLFFAMLEKSATIMNQFTEYDVAVLEEHHNQKKDAPSGTALRLGDILLDNLDRKKELVLGNPTQPLKEEDIQIGSVRCGFIPGNHDVVFDSEFDTIRLSHTARTRDAFALGAIIAAQWILDKPGFYSEKNIIASWLEQAK